MSGRSLARSGGRTWVLLAIVAGQACLPSSELVGTASSSIVEGKPAAICEWPSAGVLLPSGCSGALIHRRAFATAAHCLFDTGGRLQAPSSVVFGQSRDQPKLEVGVSTCFLSEPQNGDFAVCVLSADVPGIPIIPVMAPCETEWLEPGKTAIEVGFGDTSAVPERAEGGKNWLEVTLVRARSNESYLEVSAGSQAGEYYGDSGGPLFFRMPDGTWRLVGTDSGSPDIVAGSAAPRFSVYANAPYFVAWAEQMTGLDLTPCHDERGWHPGGACAEFPVSESPVDDSWANNCSEQPTARPQPSCPDSGSAGGTGAGGAETSGALGEGGAAFIAVEDGNGSPAQGFQPAGGCSQGVGTIHAWSQVFTLLALIGLRRRREGPQR